MKKSIIKALFGAALLSLVAAGLISCKDVNHIAENTETGKASVSMFIPDYYALSENSSRVAAPQTASVKLGYKSNGSFVYLDAVNLSSATREAVNNTSSSAGVPGYIYTITFSSIPSATYARGDLKVQLINSAGNVITEGTNSESVTVSYNSTSTASFYTVPVSFNDSSSSLNNGEMKFYKFALVKDSEPTFTVTVGTGDTYPDVVLFNSNGIFKEYISIDSAEDATYSFGTIEDDVIYYAGIWADDNAAISSYTFAVSTSVTPVEVSYFVYHKFENLSGSYVIDSSLNETKKGFHGEQTAAAAKTITGFTPQTFSQVTLNKDELVNGVIIYYARNTYTISFDTDGGNTISDLSLKYEASISSIETPSKDNYIFDSWEILSPTTLTAIPSTMPANNISLKATWKPIVVTVKHYKQPLNGSTVKSNYELADTTTETGIYNDYTTVTADTFTGFTAQSFNQVLITGSEATVNVYYNRNSYTISFNTGTGGSQINPITQLYGTTVTAPSSNPTRSGYVFLKWNKTIPSTMPAEDTEITAEWDEDKGSIRVIVY